MQNTTLFNGVLASLSSWSIQRDVLELNLGQTCYRDLLFSNSMAAHWIAGQQDYFARALGISAIIETCENTIVLMQRSHLVGEYPEMLDVLGGHIDVEPGYDALSPKALFHAIISEVCDEIGIDAHEVSINHCIGLLENTAWRKPELVFHGRTILNEAEIKERATEANENFEYSSLIFIASDLKSLDLYLMENGHNFTPSAEGCLDLFLALLKTQKGND
ncbi:MAG: hypothetical protein DWQ10_00855 [Calditrichaeota bacterium]|nr:MAG: hypothetical protein DWQ10_00855 [Calditrichota bacterium]